MFVIPGMFPWVHVVPPSVEVANPISDDPPSVKRPVWNTETTVLPAAKLAGSTSVWCWLLVFVNVSLLIWVRGTWAVAGTAVNNSASPRIARHCDATRRFMVITLGKEVLRDVSCKFKSFDSKTPAGIKSTPMLRLAWVSSGSGTQARVREL